MIIWEHAPEGYVECVVGACYGVVGLAQRRAGWMARLECPCGRQTAAVLYPTAHEAKAWVEQRIQEQWCQALPTAWDAAHAGSATSGAHCATLGTQAASARRPLRTQQLHKPRLLAPAISPQQVFVAALRRVVEVYQHWNAFYLSPQHYGQAVHCAASMQHAARAWATSGGRLRA